jgi:hypothetical protein
MNRKLIISVIVTVLILGGLAGYAVFAPKISQNPNLSSVASSEPTPTETPAQKSLKDLLSAGQPVKCGFNDSMSPVAVSGNVYISSGKMRGDFTSMTGGQDIKSHMIVDSQTAYLWTDGSASGIKMSLAATAPGASGKGFDADKKMDYKCDPWVVDNSLFTLPKTVKFSTLSIPTSSGASASGQENKATQCSVCDNAPANSKAQCLAALGCNP